MSFRIETTPVFERHFKRLKKKFPSLKTDVARLGNDLLDNPTLGAALGDNCYKIRLAVTSKGKGKSGGARIITYVLVSAELIFLLDIFDKSEQASIPEGQLTALRKLALEQAALLPPPVDAQIPPSGEGL